MHACVHANVQSLEELKCGVYGPPLEVHALARTLFVLVGVD